MTGELFEILRHHGVLKSDAPPGDEAAFDEGLEAAGGGDALAARLFSARGRVAGDGRVQDSTPSYLSGLLIGAEIGAALRLMPPAQSPVALIGDPDLCRWYSRALAGKGVDAEAYDGEAAAVAGLHALDQLEPVRCPSKTP
jgi:2-dehydro-3-deoxygalactonokinase